MNVIETTSTERLPAALIRRVAKARLAETATGGRIAAAYAEHGPALGKLAFLLTGDPRLAEDLVQEAFVRAFARFAHLRRHEALHAYLRRTVVNLAGKHLRRAKQERARVAREVPSVATTPQQDVVLREELWIALRKLPHRQRAALVLRFYEDLSERDIARALGCRTGTVKSLVHRGLASMREEMGGDDR